MAETDDNILLVNGDLGFNVLNNFEEKFPERYLNVGIAEQNMASVAAGLALEGNMVFTYSIGNFPTLRCIEQIRNDICYHNANVKILAVGGGFAYGDLGMSHHATEDIAMMRALPNMRVYVPADAIEAVECLHEACRYNGPAYIRMARGKESNQHSKETIDITLPIKMCEGEGKIVVLAAGTVLSEAIKLHNLLLSQGMDIEVYSVPIVKPMDGKFVEKIACYSDLIITMEDHNIVGGFGTAVAEILAECKHRQARLMRIGLQDTYTAVVGGQDYLRDYYGISADKVYAKLLDVEE